MRAISRSPKRIDTKYSAAPRDSSISPTSMTRARIAASVLGLVIWELILVPPSYSAITLQPCHGEPVIHHEPGTNALLSHFTLRALRRARSGTCNSVFFPYRFSMRFCPGAHRTDGHLDSVTFLQS